MTAPSPDWSAAQVIAALDLKPHPEGGHFRETFRDDATIDGERSASTAIYFLLEDGQTSRWHTVDAAELWMWHAGAPLELSLAPPGGEARIHMLGFDPGRAILPQAIVPAHWWQQARSLGAWSLVTCTVAPGFRFEGFRMAPGGAEPPFA